MTDILAAGGVGNRECRRRQNGPMSEQLPGRDLLAGPLLVRRYRLEDAAALVEAVTASLEHLRPWMPWIAGEPQTVSQRRAWISGTLASWEAGGDMTCGMFLAESGDLVGEVPDEVSTPGEMGVDLMWRMSKQRWDGVPVWAS
jgi:hypothetical protein